MSLLLVDRYLDRARAMLRDRREATAMDLAVAAMDAGGGDSTVVRSAYLIARDVDGTRLREKSDQFRTRDEPSVDHTHTSGAEGRERTTDAQRHVRRPTRKKRKGWLVAVPSLFLALFLALAFGFAVFPGATLNLLRYQSLKHPIDIADELLVAGRYDEAIATANKAVSIGDRAADAEILIGEAYRDGGRVDEAVDAFRLACDMPDATWRHCLKGAQIVASLVPQASGDLYLAAYRMGADVESLGQIIEGLRAVGMSSEADQVASAMERKSAAQRP